MARVLVRAAFMYYAYPSGVYLPSRVDMLLECRSGELIARAAFMCHDNKGHYVLKHNAAHKGLYMYKVQGIRESVPDKGLTLFGSRTVQDPLIMMCIALLPCKHYMVDVQILTLPSKQHMVTIQNVE